MNNNDTDDGISPDLDPFVRFLALALGYLLGMFLVSVIGDLL